MKNIKLILIVLNLILFIAIYLTTNENNNSFKNDKYYELKDLSGLHNIRITKEDLSLNLSKEDHTWVIQKPRLWECDRFSISNFITIFSHLKFKDLFSREELSLRGEIFSDYGFDNNITELTLNKLNSKITIKIGNKTRDNQSVYCLIKFNDELKSETIWRVSKEIIDITSIQFEDWADRKIIKSNLYSIDEITVSFKTSKNIVNETTIKKNLNNWTFAKPFKSEANNDMVRLTINKLLSEQVMDYKTGSTDNIYTENINNDWELKLTILNLGREENIFFSSSISSDTGKYRLCKTNYSPHLIKVSDNIAQILSNWSTKLRERRIFKLIKNQIKLIRISSKNSDYTLERTPKNEWIIKHQKDDQIDVSQADNQSINELINSLNQIEVKEFVSFNTDESELAIKESNDAVYTLVVQKNDTTIKTLFINNNEQDASLWKTHIIEDSLLCLVENDWSKVLSNEFFRFKEKRLIQSNHFLSISDFINIKKNTSFLIDSNISTQLTNSLNSDRVENYINNNATDEGTWINGDWVPWFYKIKLKNNDATHVNSMLLSEVFNQNICYGTFTDNNLSFNLTNNTIKIFTKLLDSIN